MYYLYSRYIFNISPPYYDYSKILDQRASSYFQRFIFVRGNKVLIEDSFIFDSEMCLITYLWSYATFLYVLKLDQSFLKISFVKAVICSDSFILFLKGNVFKFLCIKYVYCYLSLYLYMLLNAKIVATIYFELQYKPHFCNPIYKSFMLV